MRTIRPTWQVVGSCSDCASSDRRGCFYHAPQKLCAVKTLEQTGALGATMSLTSASVGVFFGCDVDVIAGAPPPPNSGATNSFFSRTRSAISARVLVARLVSSCLLRILVGTDDRATPRSSLACIGKVDQLSAHDPEKKNV